MLRKYLIYLIKKYRNVLLFLIPVYGAAMLLPQSESSDGYGEVAIAGQLVMQDSMRFAVIISGMLCYVLPVLLFRVVHSRKDEDQVLALPISRITILNGNLIFSYGVAGGYYLVGTFLCWRLSESGLLRRGGLGMSAGTYVCYLLLGLIFGLALLLFNSLMFLLANNLTDGVIILAGYTILPLLWQSGLGCFIGSVWAGAYGSVLDPDLRFLSPFTMAWEPFVNMPYSSETDWSGWNWPNVIVAVLYIVLCYYGLVRAFARRKAERAEQVSNGFFAYRLLLFLSLIPCVFVVFSDDNIWLGLVFLFVAYTVGSFIYRRRIKVTVVTVLQFGVTVVVCLLLRKAAMATGCFGLAKGALPEGGDELCYEVTMEIPELSRELGNLEKEPQLQKYLKDYKTYYDEGYFEHKKKFSVELSLNLPREGQTAQEESLMDRLEEIRREAVDYFYEHNGSDDYERGAEDYPVLGLQVYGQDRKRETEYHRFDYRMPITMSLEQAQKLYRDYMETGNTHGEELPVYINTPEGGVAAEDLTVEEFRKVIIENLKSTPKPEG